MEEKQMLEETVPMMLNDEREDIQRVLGYPPGWALRWGITSVFIAVLAFILMAWFIKYPDVITAKVVVLTENPPIRVFARSDGQISSLLAEDKQNLKKGQIIAILENTANWKDIQRLDKLVEQWGHINQPEELLRVDLPADLVLGELQNSFAAHQQAVRNFQFFERQQGVFTQIASLKQQIQYLAELNQALAKQEETLSQEVGIAFKNYNRNQSLHQAGSVSEMELENAKTNYLQYRRQLEQLQSKVLHNNLQIEQCKVQIVQLQQERNSSSMQNWLATRESFERLQSELKKWQQRYLIKSPIAGRLSLTRVWGTNQFVQTNDEIATIVPLEEISGKILGKAFLPALNFGKVQVGQRVNVLLDGYPYQEFGLLHGKVKSIALLPDQDNYLLEINLPDDLITSYDRKIPFTQELSGQARIITEDRRILARIFDRLLSLLKNN